MAKRYLVTCCIALGLLVISNVAQAKEMTTTGRVFNCPVPDGYRAVRSATEIPESLGQLLSGIAPLGAEWNPSDDMDALPTRGVEFAMSRGARWIVGIGNGGFGTTLFVKGYRVDLDGKNAREVWLQEPSHSVGACAYVLNAAYQL